MAEWQQIFVEGSVKALRAFLAQFEVEAGEPTRLLLGSDLDVEPTSLAERLRALLGSASHHLLLADRLTAPRLVEAIGKSGEREGLRVHSRGPIRAMRFDFSATTYSPDAAVEIQQAMLHELPAGVTLENVREREERDPAAHGTELYAPEHDYTYSLAATAFGDVMGVVELHRRAGDFELVHAGRLHLVPELTRSEP